jgi:formylglycine-generating enzyme required for sulfatase activity
MAGNAAEWVSDVFTRFYPKDGSSEEFIPVSDPQMKTVKGGSWADSYKELKVTARKPAHIGSASSATGFRLVAGYKPE